MPPMEDTTHESRTLSVRINRPFQDVYAFASVPENFPHWATGLGTCTGQDGDGWTFATLEGPMNVRFSPPNSFGILDHVVMPPAGPAITIPMRVIANGTGSEVLLTLFRLPDQSDEKFTQDAAWVAQDLAILKRILES